MDASRERYAIDHNRCVLCHRCIRVCDAVECAHTWDLGGRGITSRIVADLDRRWGESTSGNDCGKCVQLCPSGALFRKGATAGEALKERSMILWLLERFCFGRNYREMPVITARICGICPVSHALAAAKAGDAIKGVRIPPAAEKLRRLMHAAQFIQSHALSFFILSGPDLFLGMDGDPARRNLFGLMESMPGTVRRGAGCDSSVRR